VRRDDPSVVNANEVAIALDADIENALNSQEASRRLSESGRNELRAVVPFHLAPYLVAVLGSSHLLVAGRISTNSTAQCLVLKFCEWQQHR
jgi:hypothetical protein